MRIHLFEKSGHKYIEAAPTELLLQGEKDAITLIGLCGEQSSERLLLYAGNLSESFFDLKSGLAGAILQKFTNYHMKVALVIPSDFVQGRFKDFVLEANRGNQFRAFQEKDDAEIWLTSD
jgi:PadR family transcriptional regulator, regulatory protein AphA